MDIFITEEKTIRAICRRIGKKSKNVHLMILNGVYLTICRSSEFIMVDGYPEIQIEEEKLFVKTANKILSGKIIRDPNSKDKK